MKEQIFFAPEGEKGLNETSAQHLCAIASQTKEADETFLRNVSFIDTTIAIVGSDKQLPVAAGMKSTHLPIIKSSLNRVGRLNAFISFYSEARKALEKLKKERMRLDLEDWAKEQGIEMPVYPTLGEMPSNVIIDDIIDEMNIKDRNEYLALEAKVSVYGKFIHPSQPMAVAKSKMWSIVSAPYTVRGEGKDTLVKKHEASINPEEVDKFFMQLQSEYRSLEQNLNKIKGQLRKEVSRRNVEIQIEKERIANEYKVKRAEYECQMRALQIQFDKWKVEENERLSKIKFIIPDALASVVTELNSLGK